MKKINILSAEIIRDVLIYVDGFTHPEQIEMESNDLLVVEPLGSVLWGEIKYYVKIHEKRVEVYTSAILKGVELNHQFFSELKNLCITKNIGFNPDIDKGVILSFKQKIKTYKDIRTFLLRIYDLGRILEESNYIFKNQPDLVKKLYSQILVRIGPYEKTVKLNKEINTYIQNRPFSAEYVTMPDKKGFFDIQLGSTLTIMENESAHESIPPYVNLFGNDINSLQIFLPSALIDWNKTGRLSIPHMWDGSIGRDSNLRGLIWKDLKNIKREIERTINILNLVERDNEELPPPIPGNLDVVVKKFREFRDNKHLFLTLKNNKFFSILTEIRDIIENYLWLRWNANTTSLTWIEEYRMPTLRDYLESEQESEIIDALNNLCKSTYEIQIGLLWAERFLNKITLWLASIHVKEKKKDQNLNLSTIEGGYTILADKKEKIITTKDILDMGSMELKDFVSNIFEKSRFICPNCNNYKLLELIIYKTQQGFIFSCPNCGNRFVRPNFISEAAVIQNVFVIDTSAIVKGIPSELIIQGNLDKPLYIIPKAVELELQRLRKSNKRNKGKKGLDELMKLRKLEDEKKILLRIEGRKPTEEMIRMSKEWKIGYDTLIIEKAKEYSGTIITCDSEDLAPLAVAEGIRTLLYKS